MGLSEQLIVKEIHHDYPTYPEKWWYDPIVIPNTGTPLPELPITWCSYNNQNSTLRIEV